MRRTLIPSAKERLAEAASFTLDRGRSTPLKSRRGRMRVPKIAFELQASEGVTAVATGDAFDDDQAVDLEPIES